MLLGKSVAVVIPAYNEESQIEKVLATVPTWVDRIVVINDFSKDLTSAKVLEVAAREAKLPQRSFREPVSADSDFARADRIVLEIFAEEARALTPMRIANPDVTNSRIVLIEHTQNGGKGAGVATGYAFCRDMGYDCVVTIDGDGQMDPDEMESICLPIVRDGIDFVKGNRLMHRSASKMIPPIRFLGNSVLSILTKVASGYWGISDFQTGYTAIGRHMLEKIRLNKIYPRYGMPNDLLVKLNIESAKIREVEIKPVYGVGENSKMKIHKVVPTLSKLLLKSFFQRLWLKYFLKSFHPLFVLYLAGFISLITSVAFLGIIVAKLFETGVRPPLGYYFAFTIFLVTGIQFILFSMWMDLQDNQRLEV